MSNHAYVKTRKNMSSEGISQILDNINSKYFRNNLKIEYFHAKDEKELATSWGEHTWTLNYISEIDGEDWGGRVCWLETPRHFEIRHGGGGSFLWWLDTLITNAVAARNNGIISDDGCEDKWKGHETKYPTFRSYVEAIAFDLESQLLRINFENEVSPPEFRIALNEQEMFMVQEAEKKFKALVAK